MSEPAVPGASRGGPQIIPRPVRWRVGPGPPWEKPPPRIRVADVRAALSAQMAGGGPSPVPAEEVPSVALPGPARRPAAVLCVLFDEEDQAHVVLTRRSSRLRSHTHQVSFPGGRLEPGEEPIAAALRETEEEVGIPPASVEVVGELPSLRTVTGQAPIRPFVGVMASRPDLQPNPEEVERAFTVPLVELTDPEVYRDELWVFPDGVERAMYFFELIGDTVWGATARMLMDLLELVVAR